MPSNDVVHINPLLLTAFSHALQKKSQWPDKARLVLMHCLVHFDHKTGLITQSPSNMAQECDIDPKIIGSILKELVDLTYLESKEYADTTCYSLNSHIVQLNRTLAGIECGGGEA